MKRTKADRNNNVGDLTGVEPSESWSYKAICNLIPFVWHSKIDELQ